MGHPLLQLSRLRTRLWWLLATISIIAMIVVLHHGRSDLVGGGSGRFAVDSQEQVPAISPARADQPDADAAYVRSMTPPRSAHNRPDVTLTAPVFDRAYIDSLNAQRVEPISDDGQAEAGLGLIPVPDPRLIPIPPIIPGDPGATP